MLDKISISKRITIGPMPCEKGLDSLAKKGFKTIVNLSKKGELNQELTPEQENQHAQDLGMDYIHIPVSLSNLKEEQVNEFCEKLDSAQAPIYIHCRIGQRSGPLSMIYYAKKRNLSVDQLLAKAQKLGLVWKAPMISDLFRKHLK